MSNSDWIDGRIAQQVARLIESGEPWGSRLCAIVEGISNQEGVVNTFATSVKPDVPGETYARKYLEALKKAKSDLQTEAARSGSATDYEGEIVYWSVHAAIVRDGAGKTPMPIDLTSRCNKSSKLSTSMTEYQSCRRVFHALLGKLPFDSSGICYLEEDASRLGIGPGIRINEKLQEFPAEAKVALLHEMIHATGVRKHKHDFVVAIIELFEKKAYIDRLIL